MEKVKIAQWGGKHLVYLPLYAAIDQGIFKNLGLDLELYPAGNDDQIFREVASGKAHFGVGDPTFVAGQPSKQPKAKLIATLVTKAASWGYSPHPEIHFCKSIDDLVALRFGVYPEPSTSFATIDYIKRSNSKHLNSLEIIEGNIGELESLLHSGKADILMEVEPAISFAEERGLRVVISLSDFFPEFLYTGITANTKYLEESPKTVVKFLTGLQAGLSASYREPEMLLESAKRLFPALSHDCIKNAVSRMQNIQAWPEQLMVNPKAWSNALSIRSNVSKNLMDYVDLRFAKEAILG